MSSPPSGQSAFFDSAISMLEDAGVRNPSVGEPGAVPVKTGSFEIIDQMPVRPAASLVSPESLLPYPGTLDAVVESSYQDPLCSFVPCGILDFLGIKCERTVASWKTPSIKGNLLPKKIPSATVHLNPTNPRIEGSVQTSFDNQSQRGEKGTQKVYRCHPNDRTKWTPVPGSATVGERGTHKLVVNEINRVLDTISDARSSVSPNITTKESVTFQKRGAFKVIKSIFNILTSGSMTTDATVKFTLSYNWRGRSESKSFQKRATLRLPVGKVNYAW